MLPEQMSASRSGGTPRPPSTPGTKRTTGIVTARSLLRGTVQPSPRSAWLLTVAGMVLGIVFIGLVMGNGGHGSVASPTQRPSASPIALVPLPRAG